jgi:serine/threonine protein kinase
MNKPISNSDSTRAYQPPPSPAPGERFAPGSLLAGRYRIVARLGKGGMGEVYRADDLTLGQPVSLKFLPANIAQDRNRIARFRKEVAAARKVSHPNVCRVYDIAEWSADGQAGAEYFLTMEFVDGEDLASALKRLGRMTEEKGVEIARQLCSALAAVHDQGLLHRDLKPANVMLDGRGQVRLTDFGLAAVAQDLSVSDVRSSPRAPAARLTHASPPYGRPRSRLRRTASSSFSVMARLTCSSQFRGQGHGPSVSRGVPSATSANRCAALPQRQFSARRTRRARRALRSTYRQTVR